MLSLAGTPTWTHVTPTLGTPTWTQLAPAGTLPEARLGHRGVYDPVEDRLVIFGGQSQAGTRSDLQALRISELPRGPRSRPWPPPSACLRPWSTTRVAIASWSTGASPAASSLTLTATPAAGYRFVMWEGFAAQQNPFTFAVGGHVSMIALFAPAISGVEDGSTAAVTLDVAPNPGFGPTQVRFSLPRAGPVRVAVHDLAGREVAQLTDDAYAPGAHELTWVPDGAGSRPSPGVYFVRLEFAGRVTQRTLILLK